MKRLSLIVIYSIWSYGAANATDSDTHIRTLAASCAACHGTNGVSVGETPSLAALDENYFISKMQEYRTSTNATEVMVQHAKGLTEDEIQQLAGYFAGLTRSCPYYRRHPAKPNNE